MRIALCTIALLVGTPLSAQTVGLIFGNEDYDNFADVSRADRVVDAQTAFSDAGVRIVSRRDGDSDEMFSGLVEFGQMVRQSEAAIVVLSGRFLRSSTETYFLATDADVSPLATISTKSLPLSTVLAWLSAHPGKAVLVLATDDNQTEFGPYLSAGIGTPTIPQGVTVIQGEPRRVEPFLDRILAKPDEAIGAGAERYQLKVTGFAPADHSLIEPTAEPTTETPPDTGEAERRADIEDWRRARDANTQEAYEAYIAAHPNGEFVRMADSRLQALLDTPEARAERAEQALDLSRDARRDIQRDLTLLGFNTRGIDGIFGRGTRAAIANWQGEQGYEASGYISAEQITRLDAQAERRALELEAEAEERRRAQLAEDRAFWQETGAFGDEAGLRAYLNRYPDGEYAELATERLDQLEQAKRDDASSFDRQLWDEATRLDSIEGYEEYLRRTDESGAFAEEALARLSELREAERQASQLDQYAREEQALNLSSRTRRIVESRLDNLGLKPGPVDGVFDDDTRRAIRRYQSARNLPETGYLSEAVVVQLLADSVRQIFR